MLNKLDDGQSVKDFLNKQLNKNYSAILAQKILQDKVIMDLYLDFKL